MLMIMVLMVMMADEKHDDIFFFGTSQSYGTLVATNFQCLSVRRILGMLRSVAFFACCCSGFLQLCELGFFPVVEDHPHEASSASADVDKAVVLPFQATMAGCHSEPVGLLSQLVVSVLSQDFLLLPIQFFVVLLQALQHCAPSQPSSSFLGFADFFLCFWSSLSPGILSDICAFVYLCIYIFVFLCICIFVFLCICILVCLCISVFVYSHFILTFGTYMVHYTFPL